MGICRGWISSSISFLLAEQTPQPSALECPLTLGRFLLQGMVPGVGGKRGCRLACISCRAWTPTWPPAALRGEGAISPAAKIPSLTFWGAHSGVWGALSLTSPQQQGPVWWAAGVLCGGAVSGPGDELVDQQPVVAVLVGEALAAQLLPRHGVRVVRGSLGMDGRGCGKGAGAHPAVPRARFQLLGF